LVNVHKVKEKTSESDSTQKLGTHVVARKVRVCGCQHITLNNSKLTD